MLIFYWLFDKMWDLEGLQSSVHGYEFTKGVQLLDHASFHFKVLRGRPYVFGFILNLRIFLLKPQATASR
jgi:hypothetical protein